MGKRIIALLIISLLITALVGCNTKDAAKDKIVVGSKPHAEQYILAEMVSILIEENTDIEVERKLGIAGGTVNLHPALLSGDIDIYPEYTGTAWLTVLKKDPISDPETLYEETKKAYKEKFNIEWLGRYGFNNTYALAVKESVADELNIDTYTELIMASDDLVFGSNPDFFEREDGFDALIDTYDFNFKDKKEINIGLRYEAVEAGEIDVVTAFTTDGGLKEYNLVTLKDDKNFFTSYHGATIVRAETLEKHPQIKSLLNKLDNRISDDEMMEMNYEVEKNKKDPAEVARTFLREKGLI